MLWHAGCPLFVIIFKMLKAGSVECLWKKISGTLGATHPAEGSASPTAGVVSVPAAVAALTLVATAYQDILPAFIVDSRFTPALRIVVAGARLASVIALALLTRRRPGFERSRVADRAASHQGLCSGFAPGKTAGAKSHRRRACCDREEHIGL